MGRAANIRKGLFSLSLALILGLGSMEALAAPAAVTPGTARYCSDLSCHFSCRNAGASAGYCEGGGGTDYTFCICYWD